MSPTPLNKVKGVTELTWYADCLSEKADLAALIMRVIALGSTIDATLTEIFCRLLHVDLRVGAYVFVSVQSPRAREDMIREAASVTCRRDKAGLELIDAVLKKLNGTTKVRNRFAHGIWGIPSGKDAIVHIDSDYIAKEKGGRDWLDRVYKMNKSPEQINQIEAIDHRVLTDKYPYTLYTRRDLENEVNAAKDSCLLVFLLESSLDRDMPDEDREVFRTRLKEALAKKG